MATPRTHILTPDELEKLMETAIARSRDDMKALINEVLDKRQELVGHPTDSVEARAAVKADAEFIRSQRLLFENTASQIGSYVLRAIFVGLLAAAGYGAKKMGAF